MGTRSIKQILPAGKSIFQMRRVVEMVSAEAKLDERGLGYIFNTLLDASPEMIFRLNLDGTVLDFYAAAEMDSHLPTNDLIGQSIEVLLPPENANQVLTLAQRAIKTGQLQVCSCNLRSNVQRIYIEARYLPCARDEVIVIICDITARKHIETALRESEARFKNAFDHSVIGRVISSPQGRLLRVNQCFCHLLGYIQEDLLQKRWSEIIFPQDYTTLQGYIKDLNSGKIPSFRSSQRLIHKNGELIWVDLAVVILRDSQGSPLYLICDIIDMTSQVLAIQALQESEAVYRAFVEGTDDLIIRIDPQARIDFINHRSLQVIGLHPENCVNMSAFEFVHPEDRKNTEQAFFSWIERKVTNATYENRIISSSGEVYHMHWTFNFHYVPSGELACINGIARDITDRKVAEQVLEYMATHDSLTGLPNRTLFSDRLRHALARAKRSEKMIAVLFIDLDGFKSVNDAFGHEIGDQVLKLVADKLRRCIRSSDTVARLSGDEFILVIENLSKQEDAVSIASKILGTVSAPLMVSNQHITITASIGLSLYPIDGEDELKLLQKADAAMYQVKNNTKNGFRLFSLPLERPL
jgi:two-component system CheB/CheR fusion protein